MEDSVVLEKAVSLLLNLANLYEKDKNKLSGAICAIRIMGTIGPNITELNHHVQRRRENDMDCSRILHLLDSSDGYIWHCHGTYYCRVLLSIMKTHLNIRPFDALAQTLYNEIRDSGKINGHIRLTGIHQHFSV